MGERTLGTKLRPLVQLVPAAVVAAVILITLPSTRPVLAEVPERLSAVIEASSEEPESAPAEEEEEDLLPTLPYEDGVYPPRRPRPPAPPALRAAPAHPAHSPSPTRAVTSPTCRSWTLRTRRPTSSAVPSGC